ncbi:DNA/RNA non-specific endonuclease [Arthrobacter sp. FW305-BF8]|uniref:DNA/RNA non-specific endonuclease n=1 Tax=Arthrobacter sp. FW305-BF8 TaxID=2879617 RepID=UPI001F0207BA|nr:DNA/RNA non-specific endonuclease [Arthrobacter sp. FW305-BF8]UKA52309.1 DNA/RNA non-specific endonuclease [Arthrobacter sp. FW305-BF8]
MTTSKASSGKKSPAEEKIAKALRQFIRTRGAEYLKDPNITSIGVGYKVSEGTATGELALQFTVDQKAAPEDLGALDTAPIPESIMVDGVAVPTDVIQRSYRPGFRVVAEAEPPAAKVRADPVLPGISVAHTRGTAGTIGCIVYDKTDGAPLVLSNWHVLNGPGGALGDTVVQPGPHDDNRVDRNRLGVLKRSHLGVAGDCAVATIEGRGIEPEILGIGTAPQELGEPEIGDKVMKSGRTTGVTHGVVRRVDVIAKLTYGTEGEHAIGGFEIGLDQQNLPDDGEISRGGDSGSAWIFKNANGSPGTVLAGLHFAGETGATTDEYALACLPQSVFEKLEITLVPPAPEAFPGEAVPGEAGGGYDAAFLGVRVGLPALAASLADDAVLLDGHEVIPYTHFSLAMSASRRFARWVAWNIDGTALKKIPRKALNFTKDPRIPAKFQCGNELYSDNRLDRGHLARRADLLWGDLAEADRANRDSFFYTNITPQMDDFNQSSRSGIWGRIEDAVFADVEVEDLRVSVFGGPVFQDDDRVYRTVPLPREYWKIVAFVEDGQLKGRGFLLTQNLNQLEALELDEFRVFQVGVSEVEERTGLRFPEGLRNADTFPVPESLLAREPLDSPAGIQW